MTARKVLIAEDVALMRDSMREILSAAGFEVAAAADGSDALARFAQGDFPVVVTDLRMPGLSGIELLERLMALDPKVSVVVVTAYATVKTAVEAIKKGAFDYLVKPFEAEELEVVVGKAFERYRLSQENEGLRQELARVNAFEWVGEGPSARALKDAVRKVAASASTVLIRGESGTGKEVAARAIHAWGPRRDRPLVCVNCAALSAGLLESELFGHEKGAFTGAERSRQGRFELAEGGAILLDEVSEIDLALQAKLLRILQERTFERVGSSESRKADVRVIATTNRPLEDAVAAGAFRKDLFFRLNVVPIHLPALREHPEDIPILVEHFLRRIRARGGRAFQSVDAAAVETLKRYPWPGNVRELENVVERACLFADGEILKNPALSFLSAVPPLDGARGAGPRTLAALEKEAILAALAANGGQRRKTAAALGIAERTLREKLREWKEVESAAPGEESAATG